MKTLDEIKLQIDKWANQVGVPSDMMPSFGDFKGKDYSYIYIKGNSYHWITNGNMPNLSDRATSDVDELSYMVLETLTRQMGLVHEVMNRDPDLDNRRLAYQHQLELLEMLDNAWKARREREISEEIKWYPYKDTK
jgi:hypothetical protein